MRTPVFAIVLIIAAAACSRTIQQKDYASAEQAVQALVAAAQSDNTQALLEVLGPDARAVVDSGDPVQDRNSRERFLQSYTAAHALHDSPEMTTLKVGADEWPFPFPLVKRDGRWQFDSTAGVEEVINRRVGENELSTIQSCLAYVDAQREYYSRNVQRDPLQHYAQKLVSSEGKQDGLYWPTTDDEPPSPLGERFALARSEGYFKEGAVKGAPFHGYIYRLLKAQGPHAAGGAYDYMARDKMLGGFALLAFPAEYGSTGVVTFIVNHDGVVFSKDLGPQTQQLAMATENFDPDETWEREAAVD